MFTIATVTPILLKIQSDMAGTSTLPLPSVSPLFWEQSTTYFDHRCVETAEAVNPPAVDKSAQEIFFARIWTYENSKNTFDIKSLNYKCAGSCSKMLLVRRMNHRLRLLKRPHGLQLLMYRELKRRGRSMREHKGGFLFVAAGKISRE